MHDTLNPGRPMLLQGNEAMVEGALAAGCRFFAGYPITPATEISEVMSWRLPALDGTFIQMEDEIASMGAVIGASLAGVKAMTATSGPGFSLMQENLGFACMAEVPCVIVNVMRGGPSTGLPTHVAQGDVQQARWGTHGDHPIIVLAPPPPGIASQLTVQAFNLSEKYRTPVIILSDEVVAHTREKILLPPPAELEVVDRVRPTMPPEWYIPYEDTRQGRAGHGHLRRRLPLPRHRPGPRRARLSHGAPRRDRAFPEPPVQQDQPAFCGHQPGGGAPGGRCRGAGGGLRLGGPLGPTGGAEARERGVKAGLIKLITLWPFPWGNLMPRLRQGRAVLVPELNMGQIAREVKRIAQGLTRVETINRMDGNLITPEQILEGLLHL